jgi:small subunit ribosomal protein S2
MPKKEGLKHRRELEKLRRNLGGIRDLDRLPDTVFVIDTKKEHIAVTEANKLGMPIVAVVDTNCDPDVITYVIHGNDDAIRSGALMCRVLAEAVIEGRWVAEHQRAVAPPAPAPPGRSQLRRVGAGTTGTLDPSAGVAPEEAAAAPTGAPSEAASNGGATPPAPAATPAPTPATAEVPAPATAEVPAAVAVTPAASAPASSTPESPAAAAPPPAPEVTAAEVTASETPPAPTAAPAEEG